MSTNKAFLGINLDLLENPKYKKLDTRAAILYSLYADRSEASLHNARQGNMSFCDAHGVFIRFSNNLAADIIRVSEKTISKFRTQLVNLDLIEVVRDGLRGYKIYVKAVQETPEDVELLLPWKNHAITLAKTFGDWTLSSKLNFVKKLAQKPTTIVKEHSTSTNQKIFPTRLSNTNLSHVNNYIDLTDNTRVRKTNAYTPFVNNPYHSLPEQIKKSFNRIFGFITPTVAIELKSLINDSSADMVNYAITKSEGRKITSPIKYLRGMIMNALKAGAKCVEDMIKQTNNYQRKMATKFNHKKYKTPNIDDEQALQELKAMNPKRYAEIQLEKDIQENLADIPIPIFKLTPKFN